MQNSYDDAFLVAAIEQLWGIDRSEPIKILDFGCGQGHLVDVLLQHGFDAYGCDIEHSWSDDQSKLERLRTITKDPYRLPFDENIFDFVVSTSVLEHAQNKKECFLEIYRVLKPGGYSMHLYPGKWYLPYEPHIYVPLANYFWPYCPKWWLEVWAILGVRNRFQTKEPWQTVAIANQKYCQNGLSYWTTGQYRKLSLQVFGNCHWPMQFYLDHSSGGFARVFKRLPFKTLSGLLSREIRMAFMIQRKAADNSLQSNLARRGPLS